MRHAGRDASKDGRCEASRQYRSMQDMGEDLRCRFKAIHGLRYCKKHGAATIRDAQNVILAALALPQIGGVR